MTNKNVNVEKGKQGFQPRPAKPESSVSLGENAQPDFGVHYDTIKAARKEYLAGNLTVDKIDMYLRDVSKEHARSRTEDGHDPMARFTAERELKNLFSEHLCGYYFKADASPSQRKTLFDMAWDRGHSGGLRDVEQEYIDLCSFLESMQD